MGPHAETLSAPDIEGPLASVSYAPFAASTNPDEGGNAQAEQIRADIKMLAPLTRAVRTYSSTGGVELVPGIASEFGLRVTVGAWIDKHKDRNEREIRSVIDLPTATATSTASSSATRRSIAATRASPT